MRKLLAFLLCALPFLVAAQGTIRGKITDGQTGESLIGASAFVEGTTMGAMADLDGNFNLTGLAPGTYNVTGRFIGCTSVTESVTITGDEVVIVNFNLLPETFVIEQAAEVVAKVDRTRDVYMENIKKKSASSIDYISSQQIKRTGDSNAASAMKRISGVSTVGQLRLRPRPVRPLPQDHAQRGRGPLHRSAPEHHRDGPVPDQPRGQPDGGQDPDGQPSLRPSRRLHLRGDQGFPGGLLLQLQLEPRVEHEHHRPGRHLERTQQHRLARLRRRACAPCPPSWTAGPQTIGPHWSTSPSGTRSSTCWIRMGSARTRSTTASPGVASAASGTSPTCRTATASSTASATPTNGARPSPTPCISMRAFPPPSPPIRTSRTSDRRSATPGNTSPAVPPWT